MPIKIIETKNDLTFDHKSLDLLPLPTKVLMVKPTYFNIDTPINAHMLNAQGKPHHLDKTKALQQWNELKAIYEKLNFKVHALEGVEKLPDMVFCANQSFPYLDSANKPCAVLANMCDDTRHKEVEPIHSFLKSQHYSTNSLASRTKNTLFEGMGDVTFQGQNRLIIGGYGFRTSKNIYKELVKLTQIPAAIFELKNPKFYHLDTCLSILNSTTALVCKEAFTPSGFELLSALFPNLLLAPLHEADAPGFACNAHCPDEKHVIIQKGNIYTNSLLAKHKFVPIEVDTSEFIKSGGSVYCMKLMYY